MVWKIDKTLGYVYKLDVASPYANSQGKVYQHHEVMCTHIGRKLTEDECVHHIDRNRSNNDLSNLMLLTHSEHARLHAVEDMGGTAKTTCTCSCCLTTFEASSLDNRKFCSVECAGQGRRKFNPSKEELTKLVWDMPATAVAALFGVSDSAVSKRCKLLGISKPPRGYWAKVESGAIKKIILTIEQENQNDNFTY